MYVTHMALSELGEQDQPTESVVPKKPVLPAWAIVSAMLINNMSPGDIIKGCLLYTSRCV